MIGVLLFVYVVYVVGGVASLFVFPARCGAGGSPPLGLGAYMTAIMHPASRRNGIPWLVKSFVKMIGWPIVFYKWWSEGKPPSPVLFGEAAAEKLGIDPADSHAFATMWTAPITPSAARAPTSGVARLPTQPSRDPSSAVMRQVAILSDEIRANDIDERGLVNRPRYNKAMSTLTTMGGTAVPALLDILDMPRGEMGSLEDGVAESVVEVLGKIGDSRSVPALAALLAEPVASAPFALARMKDPAGVEALLDALEDPRSHVRSSAALGLAQSRTRHDVVLPALVRCLQDPSPTVRARVAVALESIGNPHPRVIAALRALATTETVEWVQQTAVRSLERLGEK